MTGSPPLFSTTRRRPRRVMRGVALGIGVLVVLAAGWAVVLGGLWAYAWLQLGGTDVAALHDDLEPLGASGASAPAGSTTVLVVLTDSVDPTIPREPALVASPVLVQVGGPRTEPAVLILPRALEVEIDGRGAVSLEEIQLAGGADLLVRGLVDYTEVRIDHVVSLSVDALPALVDALGPVEVCGADGCSEPTADELVEALRAADDVEAARIVADVVDGLAGRLDLPFVVRSPLATKRAIDAIAAEISTDVSLRGARALSLAGVLAQPTSLDLDIVPLLTNPRTDRVIALEEPTAIRFQHLRDGTSLTGTTTTDPAEDLISQVDVAVLNGAGIDGLASKVQVRLQASGYVVIGTGNAPSFDRETTVVNYQEGDDRVEFVAVLLAEALGGASLEPLQREPTFEGEPVDLLVTAGRDLDD